MSRWKVLLPFATLALGALAAGALIRTAPEGDKRPPNEIPEPTRKETSVATTSAVTKAAAVLRCFVWIRSGLPRGPWASQRSERRW